MKKPSSLTMKTEALIDPELSAFVKGVLATALATGATTLAELLTHLPDDRGDVRRAIKELRVLGYCKAKKVDGVTQYKFLGLVRSRVKNKNSYSYSKNRTQVRDTPKQIDVLAVMQREDEFAEWVDSLEAANPHPILEQLSLLPERARKTEAPVHEVIPVVTHHMLYRICFLADNERELRLVSSRDRGRVASALGRLRSGRADLSQINRFEDWWNKNWRSRGRSGQYQPPTPEQVSDLWLVAMKHDYTPTQKVPAKPVEPDIDIRALMNSKRHHD